MEGANFNLYMPSKRFDVEFENITYVAKDKIGSKEILKNVSGKFLAGELTAIMGPSGAGKTSLLNVLTGFKIQGTTGIIKCDGKVRKRGKGSELKKESCYILQEDILPPLFSVYESMMMAASLKIANLSTKSREYLVNEILDSLNLNMCRNTRCQNLSGGQKKRLSIALELIDNPPIMFLDEPTTGLDSSSSSQCIRMLKHLARGGRTVICTIHQPSAILFEMFDHVYMMGQGKCIYQGASINTVSYLSSLGFCCPQYHNPADYFLEVASGDYGDVIDYLTKAAESQNWRGVVPTITINSDMITDVNDNDKNGIYDRGGRSCSYEVPSEFSKFCILLKRTSTQIYRDWTICQLKVLMNILVGVFLGLTYQDAGNDASKVFMNLGLLLCSVIYIGYTAIMPGVLKFPTELMIVKKERFNNWYKLKTYYSAFLALDIPLQIVFSTAYSAVAFVLSAQPLELGRFSMMLFVQVLVGLAASGLGLIMGTLFMPLNGVFFGSIVLAVMICLGGFLIIFKHMNIVMYLMTYLSFTSFAVEGLAISLYGFNRTRLDCPEDVEFCQYTSPGLILEDLGMDKGSYWVDVGYLAASCIIFRIIAFCTLRRKVDSSLGVS